MTRSPSVARTSAMIAAAKLDEYWSHLRMTDPELFGKHMLKLPNQKLSSNVSEKSLSISGYVLCVLPAEFSPS